MIIRIDGKLFTIEPDRRFANEQNLPQGFWNELWRRYSFLQYTATEVAEYFELKTGRKTSTTMISRWIFRTEIYHKAQPFVKKGVQSASTKIFGELEEALIKELTKQFKDGDKSKHRIII